VANPALRHDRSAVPGGPPGPGHDCAGVRPFSATWDRTILDPQCLPNEAEQISIYVSSAISIVSDVIFATIPLIFIRELKRPLREKLVLAFLMGLGILTAVTAAIKVPSIKDFGQQADVSWDGVNFVVWSIVEEQVGIIAACIPYMRGPFQSLMQYMGLVTVQESSAARLRPSDQAAEMSDMPNGVSKSGQTQGSVTEGRSSDQELLREAYW